MQQRIPYIDIAKGIGIFCVILGHMNNQIIRDIVVSFHMPLFFFLAGFFVKRIVPWRSLIRKKAKRLLLPYLFTCCSILLFVSLKHLCVGHLSLIQSDFLQWTWAALYGSGEPRQWGILDIKSIGPIWFLWGMFFGLLIYNFVLRCKHKLLMSVILFLSACTASYFCWLPWSFLPGVTAVLFLHIGQLSYAGGALEKLRLPYVVLAGIIWGLCVYLVPVGLSMVGCSYNNIPVNLIESMAGTFIILYISRLSLHFPRIAHWIELYGKYSLIVLCFHTIELYIMPWTKLISLIGVQGIGTYFLIVLQSSLRLSSVS